MGRDPSGWRLENVKVGDQDGRGDTANRAKPRPSCHMTKTEVKDGLCVGVSQWASYGFRRRLVGGLNQSQSVFL